jgi:hypothetical protein
MKSNMDITLITLYYPINYLLPNSHFAVFPTSRLAPAQAFNKRTTVLQNLSNHI